MYNTKTRRRYYHFLKTSFLLSENLEVENLKVEDLEVEDLHMGHNRTCNSLIINQSSKMNNRLVKNKQSNVQKCGIEYESYNKRIANV